MGQRSWFYACLPFPAPTHLSARFLLLAPEAFSSSFHHGGPFHIAAVKAGCCRAPHQEPRWSSWRSKAQSASHLLSKSLTPSALSLPSRRSLSHVLPQLLSASPAQSHRCQVLSSSAPSGCDSPRPHTGLIPFHRWLVPLLPLPTINKRSLCDSAFWCDQQHWGETT